MKKTVLSILLCISLVACYYDKADVINPNAAYVGCDTTSVNYNSVVAPILSNNGCLSCHSGSASSGGKIPLDTYTSAKSSAVKGELLPSVRQDATCAACGSNYAPMPAGGSKISDCNINKIAAWINQGCKN